MTLSQEKNINLDQDENIHPIYKKLGETPLQAIDRFRKDNPRFTSASITYAGRLDPMAEGLILLLTNEKVNEKDKYLNLQKTYEVGVLWGFSTDTQDLLGKITNSKLQVPSEQQINEYLIKSIGEFDQSYPAYSSKPVNGKPLFTWAREGKLNEIQIPSHAVSVFSAEYLERKIISNVDLNKLLEERINLVSGDFRQNEILEKWKEVLVNSGNELIIDKFILNVSSGFYVRQFVSDMAKNFETCGTTFHIKRIKVGDYDIAQLGHL